MRTKQKMIALIALTGLLNSFGMHSVTAEDWKYKHELTHTKIKLIHKPFWLFTGDDANKNKNSQLKGLSNCLKGNSFTAVDDNGNRICKGNEERRANIPLDGNNFVDPTNESDGGADDFLDDLFGDDSLGIVPVPKEENTNEGTEDFLDDLFDEDNFNSTEATNINGNNNISGGEEDFLDDLFNEDNFNSTEDTDTNGNNNTSGGEDDLEDVDDFLGDIFGKTITERLMGYKDDNDILTLQGKSLSRTLKKFSSKSTKMNISNIKVSVLKGQGYYNAKVADLLHKVDKDFKIDSIKNDFAKNISAVSYSLSTFIDEDINNETQKVFRKKLIKDLKTLQSKYRVLKRKDMIVSKTLEKRGAL